MNILASCIGRRGYLAQALRPHLRPGERIIGTSNTPHTPAFRYCDEAVLLPDIGSEGYAEAVLEVVRTRDVGLILSLYDLDLEALAPHRPQLLASGVAAFLPSQDVSRACLDKALTPGLLAELGFEAPRTYLRVEDALRDVAAGALSFPLVVKHRFGFGSRSLAIVHSELQLRGAAEAAAEPVIQECLPGVEHSFDLLNDLQGRCVRAVVKRKVAMRSGETDVAVTVRDDALEALAFRLGDALDVLGPCDVDLFVRAGRATILEINPRFGGGYPAAHLAGADYPGLLVAMARGAAVEPQAGAYRDGVRMFKDIVAFDGAALDAVPCLDLRNPGR